MQHYDLDLTFDPATRVLSGKVRVSSTATAALDVINIDFIGFEVSAVTLAGSPVDFDRSEGDVVITPPDPLQPGENFILTVYYTGVPEPFTSSSGAIVALGWRQGDGGLEYVRSEPDGSRAWFPANDHPSDKATYTFRVTVPSPLTAVANGVLSETVGTVEGTTWIWQMDQPMATYLATVIIGDLTFVEDPESTALSGVAIRNVLPSGHEPPEGLALDALASQGEMIAFYSELFGPYPFDTYGVALVPDLPGGLETQSLSIIGVPFPGLLAHEIAHQWFGNHVSIADWSDIWLNEGFATYATWLWSEHVGDDTVAESVSLGYELINEAQLPPPGDPPSTDVFNQSVYVRGALTLHALRIEIGDDHFFDLLLVWISRYGGTSASTEDFIALAEEVSSTDLTHLFDAWLYQPSMPPLPSS